MTRGTRVMFVTNYLVTPMAKPK